MSYTDGPLSEIMYWAAHGGEKAIEFTEFVIKYSLMHVVTGGIAGVVAYYASSRNIHKGLFKEHTVNVGETLYTPSGIINPATGEEFIDQRLITLDDSFFFRKAFRGQTGKELARRMEKAAKLTEISDPIILSDSNLRKVVRDVDFEQFKKMVAKQWRGHHSGLLNNGDPLAHELSGRQYPEETIILPLPIKEKSVDGVSCKVLFFPMRYLEDGGLPRSENLRVQVDIDDMGHPVFEYNPAHEANERLRTNQIIRDIVNQDRSKWLSTFGVSVQTGKILEMASPTI